MLAIKKDNVNWLYIALGLFFGLMLIWPGNGDIQESRLVSKTVVVSQDIHRINGRRIKYKFRFQSNEYACSFVIKTPGAMAAHWKDLDNITRNDTLRIKFSSARIPDLDKESEHIPIYSLVKNGIPLYDTKAYNVSQKLLDKRWNIIYGIMSLLLLLRGFAILSGRNTYLLVGLSAVIIITLRILHLWW